MPVDARSDQVSFGLILYELASGKRAFVRSTSADTIGSIIREEAEPLPATVPAPVRWIIDRGLAKEAAERYDSTGDLYRELRQTQERLSETSARSTPAPAARQNRWMLPSAIGIALVVAIGAVFLAWAHGRASAPASFQRLTFRRGNVRSARFTPQGSNNNLYSVVGRNAPAVFSTRSDRPCVFSP